MKSIKGRNLERKGGRKERRGMVEQNMFQEQKRD